MNKVVLIGRLTKDPELKFTPGNGTAVATCTLAVDRRFTKDNQKEADFIPVVIWGKNAENTANYMNKGSLMGVSGHIQTRTYDAKDGTKRYVTEVVAEEVQFLSKGSGNSNSGNNSNYGNNAPAEKQNNTNNYPSSDSNQNSYNGDEMTPMDDGDIPF